MALAENKAIIQRYYDELWNKWDLSLVDDIIGPEICFRGSLGVAVQGRDGFKNYVATVRRAFPDFHNTIEELVAEDEKVVARLTYRGTHQGELFGIPPTDKQVSYAGIAMFRILNERIVDGWVIGDVPGLLRQLGGVAAGKGASTETTPS